MGDSYPDEDHSLAVSASAPGGSGSEEKKGTMTREERLAKLARNSIARPTRGEAKPPREDFEDIVAKPLLRKPVNPQRALGCRSEDCQLVRG